MSEHGKVENIYRIVNHGRDDLDLTRAQAIRVYRRLEQALYPKPKPKRAARPTTKGTR